MNKSVYVILLIVSIVLIIYLNIRENNKKIKTFSFPNSLIVENNTKYDKKLDTMCLVILKNILKYDTISLKIYKLDDKFKNNKLEILGFIEKNPFVSHEYHLFIKEDLTISDTKELLSHEFVHLKQYEERRLVPILLNNVGVIFNDEIIYYGETKYEDRLYEKEAFKEQKNILEVLNNTLYE